MVYRMDKAVLSVSAAAMLLLGCAWLSPAKAASVNSADGPISCSDFQRGPNGTWTVVHATTIEPQGVVIRLAPGQTVAKNQWVGGVEVTTVLDRSCGNE